MKYIIMADGKGTRWQNYNDIPKHLIEIGGGLSLPPMTAGMNFRVHSGMSRRIIIWKSTDSRKN